MPFGRHFVPDGADFSVGTDPIRHAHNAQKRFPQETFHAPCAVRLDDCEFRVGQQRKSKLVLPFEFFLRFDGVAAAANDGTVQFRELRQGVTELGRFVDSTGSIRFRIKIEDQVLVAIILHRDGRAAIVLHLKVRSPVANLEHLHPPRPV
jgi:hypothetical protein